MFLNMISHRLIIGIIIVLLLLSIICQIIIGVLYQNMIKEAENMTLTENKFLKQCKLKFANCYQLNVGMTNIAVFVDKFLNSMRVIGISTNAMGHIAGQLVLLSVFAAGVGVCKGIIEGRTVGGLLPYYIISLFGLYAYFAISSVVDIQGKRQMLKTNLIDYLENHMANRLDNTRVEEARVKDFSAQSSGWTSKRQTGFSRTEEQELEELLKEFLT